MSDGWIVDTRDVKLLSTGTENRQEILMKLGHTPFVLSPADRGSPYRAFVRRRDGRLPSSKDMTDLKSLGADVEIETINIFRKGTEIRP